MANNPSTKRTNILKQLFKRKNVPSAQADEKNIDADGYNELFDYYASLATHHPDLIIVLSPDGTFISKNRDSLNKMLGYSPKTKLDYKKLIPTQYIDKLQIAFNKTLKGNPQRQEIAIHNKEKETLYMTITFVPIKKMTTDIVEGVYLVIRDETSHKLMEQALEIKEKHLEHAQEVAKIGSWEYLIEEDKLFCSEYFYEILGMDKSTKDPDLEMIFDYFHPNDHKKTTHIIKHAIRKGIGYSLDTRILHDKTEPRFIKAQAEAIWKDNKPYKLVGIIQDVTSQKTVEQKFDKRREEQKYILDHLAVGSWMRKVATGELSYVSQETAKILDRPLEELYRDSSIWESMIHPDDKQEVLERQKILAKGEPLFHQYRIVCSNGITKWVFDQTVPRMDDNGNITFQFGMLIDITVEIEMQQQLDYFATHDTLTTLPNQRSLYEKLDQLYENNKNEFALLYLDLDRFKIINDSLGYQIGDEVLKNITNRLVSILPEDGYLSRISSNDFIILIKTFASRNYVFNFAETVIQTIEKPVHAEGYELHITTSIGISFAPEDGDNKLALIQNAHAALYHAKRVGKNNYQLYSFSRDISSYKKYILEKDLRKAIKNEEFELYYQPRVNPDTGIIRGAEALIRWNHEEWGLVSPSEFIPLAEENHLITQIGDWVIQTVCAQIRVWKNDGINPRTISINISPLRFMKKGLAEIVESELRQNDIPAKYLELEITESSLLKNEKAVLDTLSSLKDLGVSIAIDDFGTGHASLTYLRNFHADTIKIDQVFIQNIYAENSKDAAIVSSILHLAKGLDIKVVAEGVEEYEHLEFLKQKECDEIQGYLYSKPVPKDAYEKLLKRGYVKPEKPKLKKTPEIERRNYYRLEFPNYVLGEMEIIEVNNRKVNLGTANILIANISLGGLKILSSLKLPVNAAIKFKFLVQLMGEKFSIDGKLAWKNETKDEAFYYGISFHINKNEEDRLAEIINKMTVLRNLNNEIPDTNFVYENPYAYLHKHRI